MVTIKMYNVKSKIENINEIPFDVLDAICMKLSYKKTGFGADPHAKYIINPSNGVTYTGCVPMVTKILKKNNVKFTIEDMRTKPEKHINLEIKNGYTLRDYQQRIVDMAVKKHRAIFSACTSSGKTFMMANMIIAFGVRTIIIAPKSSLSVQLRREFEGFFHTHVGLLNGDTCDIQDIMVATPGTLLNYPEVMERAEAVLSDECHNDPATTIFKCLSGCKNAYYRIAVSGSPWRDDGTDILLDAAFAPRNPKDRISASELIERGILTPVSIKFFHVDSGCDWLGDYATTYSKAIINNETRNDKVVDLAVDEVNKGHETLILISKISHGMKLMKMIEKRMSNEEHEVEYDGKKYKVHDIEFVSGTDDITSREVVFKAVKEKKCKIMIASTIADEGLDLPILQTLIMAQGGKSTTRLFQRVGRVIRHYEGKNMAYVYDFIDSCSTMYKHSMIRYELEKLEPAWKICIE